MTVADPAFHEQARLATLRGLEVLDAEPGERFDRIVRLTQRLLGVPTVIVSLVDDERHWFKSQVGIDLTDGARLRSISAYAVIDDRTLVVSDARDDERFAANPLVTGAPEIRFYAGVPVRVRGLPMGALCAIDYRPRELAPADVEALQDLAAMVELELLDRHDGLLDHLTGLLNRRGLERAAPVLLNQAERDGREVAVVFGDLDGLKAINDGQGHAAGDAALQACAELLADSFRGSDVIARLSGDEFVVLLVSQGRQFEAADLVRAMDRFRSHVRRRNALVAPEPALSMSLGAASARATHDLSLGELLALADRYMYEEKGRRRRRRT